MDDQPSTHITSSRKLRVLCLHGFRTSGSIFQQQLYKLGSPILDLLDMTFLDGPRPCGGPSSVEGYYAPPYYEWYLPNQTYTQFVGFEDCLSFLYKTFDEHGPFDGLMGFSQGAVLCAALAAMQQQGLALSHHAPLQFVVIIAGGTLDNPELKKQIYPPMITCPSVHIIGENDERSFRNEALAKMFEAPIIIRHEGKHIVPRLGKEHTETFRNFFLKLSDTCKKNALRNTSAPHKGNSNNINN